MLRSTRRGLFKMFGGGVALTVFGLPKTVKVQGKPIETMRENVAALKFRSFRRYSGYDTLDIDPNYVLTAPKLSKNGEN